MEKQWFTSAALAIILIASAVAVAPQEKRVQAQEAEGEQTTTKDWSVLSAPGLGVGTNEIKCTEESAPSPTPAPQTISHVLQSFVPRAEAADSDTPRVSVTSCSVDGDVPNPNSYTLSISRVINRTSVGDHYTKKGMKAGAREIALAVCKGEPPPPSCVGAPENVGACAWWGWKDGKALIKLHALFQLIPDTIEDVMIPLTATVTKPTPRDLPGVFPVAPKDASVLPLQFNIGLWGLSEKDKETLRGVHPMLLTLIQNNLEIAEMHERGHWEIYEKFAPRYLDVINRPLGDGPAIKTTRSKVAEAVRERFFSRWAALQKEEDKAHDAFHKNTTNPTEMPQTGPIPINGLDDIRCLGARFYITTVSVAPVVDTAGIDDGKTALVKVTGSRGINCSNIDGIDEFDSEGACLKSFFLGTPVELRAEVLEEGKKKDLVFSHWESSTTLSCPCRGSKDPVCKFTAKDPHNKCFAVFIKKT